MALESAKGSFVAAMESFVKDVFVHWQLDFVTPRAFTWGWQDAITAENMHGIKSGHTVTVFIPPASVPIIRGRNSLLASDFNSISTSKVSFSLNGYAVSAVTEQLMAYTRELSKGSYDKMASKATADSFAYEIDDFAMNYAINHTYNQVGTPGTAMADLDVMKAKLLLSNLAVPEQGHRLILNSYSGYKLAVDMRNVTNSNAIPQSVLDKTYNTGQAPSSPFGVQVILVTNAMPYHTVGNHNANVSPKVLKTNGTQTDGNIIKLKGATTPTTGFLKAGDVFTIGVVGESGAVYKINPRSSTKAPIVDADGNLELAQFVVTADVTTTAATVDVPVAPKIIAPKNDGSSNDLQNISCVITGDQVINVAGAANSRYGVNLLVSPDAFIMNSVPQEIIPNKASFQMSSPGVPFYFRCTQDGDLMLDTTLSRADVLYGVYAYRTEGAVRIVSK